MIDRQLYQVEVAGRLATLYIVGRMSATALQALRDACDELPASVEVLCVSVDDLARLGEASSTFIHDLRRHWQATRAGAFRVAFRLGHDLPSGAGEVALAG